MTTVLPPTIVSEAQEIAAPSPKVTGGVLVAPLGTTLPTDATTALDPAFITLGRVSVDGVDRTDRGTVATSSRRRRVPCGPISAARPG